MASYSPELIDVMRAALDAAVTELSPSQATPAVKAYIAEGILRAAAAGQTNYQDLLAAALQHIQMITSHLV
jgi:hypothetical protein